MDLEVRLQGPAPLSSDSFYLWTVIVLGWLPFTDCRFLWITASLYSSILFLKDQSRLCKSVSAGSHSQLNLLDLYQLRDDPQDRLDSHALKEDREIGLGLVSISVPRTFGNAGIDSTSVGFRVDRC
jgi:hypothetical protein